MAGPRLQPTRSASIISARILTLVVLALLATGCNSKEPNSGSPRATPSPSNKTIVAGPDCHLPPERTAPGWVPDDVPLPPGTYFHRSLTSKNRYHRGLFVMRIDVEEFRRFVGREWRRAGIQLLRPDREPGEVEDLFSTPNGTGVFKANDVICEPPYTRLLFVYGEGRR